MHLFLTDPTFTVHGQPYPGIPFLIDDQMALVTAPNEYLFHVAVVRGRTSSPKTWQTYGNHLYEFFSFLETIEISWDRIRSTHLAAWRDSMLSRGCRRSTVNHRVGAVSNFYKWALRSQKISSLPFYMEDVRVSRPKGFLAHIDAKGNQVQANELKLRSFKPQPKFLTADKARLFVTALTPRRNRLMAYMMWFSGLRREEVATLELEDIPNPSGHPPGKPLAMTLRTTKGRKPRWVSVPYDLAVQLWNYVIYERSSLAKRYRKRHVGPESNRVFLTAYGEPISLGGINNAFKKASEKSGIKCTPHMLRHTYGTYEFIRMSQFKSKESALFWVMERMGHSSLATTQIYIHTASLVDHTALDGYQADICKLLQEDCV
jgi:integrase